MIIGFVLNINTAELFVETHECFVNTPASGLHASSSSHCTSRSIGGAIFEIRDQLTCLTAQDNKVRKHGFHRHSNFGDSARSRHKNNLSSYYKKLTSENITKMKDFAEKTATKSYPGRNYDIPTPGLAVAILVYKTAKFSVVFCLFHRLRQQR